MPAPRITTDLPAPEPWGSSGGPAHASGRLISPSAVIVSYIAAEPPAKPTCSRKRRRVTPFFFLVIWFLLRGRENPVGRLGRGHRSNTNRLTNSPWALAFAN